ncbi:hypothetical protein ACTMU2_20330 [Cupriavidus basilensis]
MLGDPTRLKEILLNLIGNAVKFTARGGITVRLDLLEDLGQHQQRRSALPIQAWVSPPSNRSSCSAPFSQADSSISRRFGGSGLGAGDLQAAGATNGRHADTGKPARNRRHHDRAVCGAGGGRAGACAVAQPAAPAPLVEAVPSAVPPLEVRNAILVVEDQTRHLQVIAEPATGNARAVTAPQHRAAKRRWNTAAAATICAGAHGLPDARHGRPRAGAPDSGCRGGAQCRRADRSADGIGRHGSREQECRDAGMNACLAKPVRTEDPARLHLPGGRARAHDDVTGCAALACPGNALGCLILLVAPISGKPPYRHSEISCAQGRVAEHNDVPVHKCLRYCSAGNAQCH